MAKRSATTEVNQDNWDDEYEEEEAGTFKQASEDVITKRKIKVAKRRSIPSLESASSSPFSNFAGFKAQTPSNKQLFNLTTNSTPTTNGADEKGKKASIFNIGITAKPNIPNSSLSTEKESINNSSEQEYAANLTSLNKKVSEWIKLHVDKNPLCILTPVFNDYDRYLKEIKEKRNLTDSKNGKSPLLIFKEDKEKLDNDPNQSKSETLLDGSPSSTQSTIFGGIKMAPTGQSILLKKPASASQMVNPFLTNFGNTADKPTSTALSDDNQPKQFSFNVSSQPFTFLNVSAPPSSNDTGEQEEETDEPPKPDFKPVQEEGALFSKRCKVFVKKDGSYADRGVGTLHVKNVSDGKYQLIVRADTVLGNILVNVLLSSSIPVKRMGKNNVMLVCLPTPDAKPPPTTVLLRVKTSEEADDLLQNLEFYTK